MATIDGSVGDGGTNAKHNVAIIQLMLHLVKNAKGQPYYAGAYSGTYDPGTKTALAQFQKDQKIATWTAKAPAPNAEKAGCVVPGSNTFAKLNSALPAAYADIRIIPNTTTVYLPAPQADATASSGAVMSKNDLDAGFQAKIANVVNTMFTRHKIALAVVGPGWRRDFATQAAQTKTGAGPGESNHNFGRAVDLGFKDLRWVNGNGAIIKEGGWLGSPALGAAKSAQFWSARDTVAVTQNGLFLTSFGGERVHLQSFSDAAANNRASLANLLTTVGTMKWQFKNNQYHADLGLAAKSVDVGTSKQIWSGKAPITKASIEAAATGKDMAALTKNALFAKLEAVKKVAKEIASAKAGTTPAAAKAALNAKQVTAADLKVIQAALKSEFEKADAGWNQWVPVK